jgi:hypothetical protein
MPGVEGELDDEDIEAAMDLRYGSRSHEYDLGGAQSPIDKQEDSSIDIQEDSSIAVGNDDSIEDAGAVGFVENAGVSADEHFVGKTGVSADEHFVGKTGVSANGPNGTAGVDEEDSSDEESEMHSATNDEERFHTHSAIFTAHQTPGTNEWFIVHNSTVHRIGKILYPCVTGTYGDDWVRSIINFASTNPQAHFDNIEFSFGCDAVTFHPMSRESMTHYIVVPTFTLTHGNIGPGTIG